MKKMKPIVALFFLACLLVCLATFVKAQTQYIDCKGQTIVGDVKITNVKVGDCIKAPCQVKRGGNASVTFTYTTTKAFDSLKLLVEGKVGIMIPFSLPENDVCKLGTTCPIKPNTPYTASFTVPVKSEYPPIKVPVYVFDDYTNKTTSKTDHEGCFEVELQLV